MKTRKARSKITKLKENSGGRMEEATQIEKMLINDFTARFKSI